MKTSKAAVAVSFIQGKIFSVTGWFFAVIMLLGFSGFMMELAEEGTTSLDGVIVVIVLFILSILAILKGIQIKRRIKRFKKYVSLISMQRMTSIGALAVNTEKTPDFVKKDLQKMIDKKFFVHASINIQANEIIIHGLPQMPQMNVTSAVCGRCGATGRVTEGQINECEYCGSVLQ